MYQPELGRFMQPDPKEFGAGDYNLYRYCHNDPVNKSDPFGFEFTDHPLEVVSSIPGHPELVGLTQFQTNIALTMTQTSGGFQLGLGRFDVTVTSKQVATTGYGRERTDSAVQATKDHENRHVSIAKALHDAVHRGEGIAKTTYRTEQEARAAAKTAGDALKAKVENQQDNLGNKNAHQGPEWKNILDKEKGYKRRYCSQQ